MEKEGVCFVLNPAAKVGFWNQEKFTSVLPNS